MTRKQVRKRRTLRGFGQKKVLIIYKTKRLFKFIDCPMPLSYWNWIVRFKSLFSFKKYI